VLSGGCVDAQQQSAFRVFSVLNSRGLDLLPTDIIKSDVIGQIPQAKRDEYTEKWEELEVETGRNGFADLFGHIRMIYSRVKARRTLIEEFKDQVLLVVSSPEKLVFDVIEPYAEAYLTARDAQFVATENASDINSLLKWLNRIDNSDWFPSAILCLAENKSTPQYVRYFLQRLERLAAYMHICAKNVNERIERYAPVLAELQLPGSKQASIKAVELTAEEKQEMLSVLDGPVYTLTARRRNYLILRLDSFLSDAAATYDPSLLTIEHVLPQTVTSDTEWANTWPDSAQRELWVHRIANLVPLTQKRNSQAQNYDFGKKKAAYFGGRQGISSYALTTQVLNTPEWTPETIQECQDMLLTVMSEKWELTN